MKKRVLIGLSGGVDSTFAAYQLKEEGYEVVGVYMKMFENEALQNENIRKVKLVGDFLGIEYHIYDLVQEFKEEVYDPFVQAYVEGETPNPCGHCNQTIKFGKMVEIADELNCELVSTGHYINTDGQYIYEAEDDTKDQTYFLFHVDPKVLKRLIFPLGNKVKQDIKDYIQNITPIKEIATQKESSEICFVDTDYRDVLRKHVDVDKPGDILDHDGNVIGQHKGYMNYTIGQRRGFETKLKKRLFINKIIPEKNQIVVGEKEELTQDVVRIKDVNLFFKPEGNEFRVHVKLRYRTKKLLCRVVMDGSNATLYLEEPAELGVAKGQAAVFYDGKKMLGGGWIV